MARSCVKKIVSMLLVLVMVFAIMPLNIFAADPALTPNPGGNNGEVGSGQSGINNGAYLGLSFFQG